MKFIDIPANQRADLLKVLEGRVGLKSAIIEKDWWVTMVLNSLQRFFIKSNTEWGKAASRRLTVPFAGIIHFSRG